MTTTSLPLRGVVASPDAEAHAGLAAMLVVLAGTFMVVLDFFIVNVAIPSMQSDLHAGSGAIPLVVAGYALALASGLLLAGRLGDVLGHRRMFAVGLGLFTLTSAVCGLAPSIGVLVGARIAQGASAALLTPQVLSILTTAFTGERRVRAFTAYGLTMGLAAVSGQLIGGLLIAGHLGWGACFLINVPVGVVALALVPRLVPKSRPAAGGRIDATGAALAAVGLVALVLPLIVGRDHGWPLWTWLSFAAAAGLLIAFGLHQRRRDRAGREPLVDPGLVREHRFALGVATTLAFWAGMASFFLVLALYLQDARGLSALDAGLVFTVLALGYLATSLAAPQIAAALGRHALSTGALTMAAGLLVLRIAVGEVGAGGHVAALIPGLALDGIGMGMVTAPLTGTVLAGVSMRHAGVAAGALSTVQQVANALGVALIGIVFYGAQHPAGAPAQIAGAFGTSLSWLIGLSVLVALLARRLTR
jgi:EmrB/QacA subfamily drug resistance transporter